MNRITGLLDLEDSDIFISDISFQDTTKFLTLENKLCAHHCPSCGFRIRSRGVNKRTIKHPILQGNYKLVLILKQHRWKCTNPECCYDISNTFKFVNKLERYVKMDRLPLTDAICIDEVLIPYLRHVQSINFLRG